ncbi:SMP-30/gluconolactonase/LRE family protein [Devosia algicola]|uniref:SMP-30/gluconolactonase/LRE family protein n=1 Tax=Devosia algicola TaxID=3026418 RepID=A0ABY7YJE5_9HYPH|nr:SMP-30/gluconolactonase/LRE family protein [Devosia algicola]WDR01302.1 SMP-30/gluconolactonase/LRE family protein [Devosia algicola]
MFGQLEGTRYEIIDQRFAALIAAHIYIERLWTGARWSEGPAWFAAGRYLIWSDIPNNRMLRWDETNDVVSVFRTPANNSNGNTVDGQGRLVSCEQLTRRLTRTNHDGTVTVLADSFDGKKLNSPNDVVCHSDGSIWFTDPTYGIITDYEGSISESEIGRSNLYRIDPNTGVVNKLADDFVQPNGLAFSPDEQALYVADSGASHQKNGPAHIRRFIVNSDGRLTGGDVFATCDAGFFDGFRIDQDGRIWTSAFDGVHCFDPDGTLLGKIILPERVGNLTFGGEKRNRLFICGTSSLYSVFLMTRGAALG